MTGGTKETKSPENPIPFECLLSQALWLRHPQLPDGLVHLVILKAEQTPELHILSLPLP